MAAMFEPTHAPRRSSPYTTAALGCALALSSAACHSDPVPADVADAGDAAADVLTDTPGGDSSPDTGPRLVVLPDEHPPCTARNPRRNPYFGDLHSHTRLSFDAITYDVRGGPAEAYAFARGAEVGLPPYAADGTPTRRIRLPRPLDFAAVTDHSEYLSETVMCNDPMSPAYASLTCSSYRNADSLVTSFSLALAGIGHRPQLCPTGNTAPCTALRDSVWQSVQDAAEAAYDRTAACSFTTFVAYEWSGSPGGNNAHRNVIFRNRTVPTAPISFFEAPTPDRLWQSLQTICLDSGMGCDVLTIPHNGNVGGGHMFQPVTETRTAYTAAESARRARLEPLVEVYQHKGASECLRGTVDPLASEDERCDFEQVAPRLCTGPNVPAGCTPLCTNTSVGGLAGGCVHPADFARGALRTGLLEWQRTGVDPFHFGLIASTDTHAAVPGATDEDRWQGHTGLADDTPEHRLRPFVPSEPAVSVVTSGPGGLAVLWAEENTRGALFDAMRRREAYGTSGTRIVVRFFGGWSYPADLCARTDLVDVGYSSGVSMGSDLPARPAGAGAPTFVLSALRDAMGAPLAQIQIVKGWVAAGATRERVFDVGGDGGAGASVDLATCTPQGTGADALCDAWTDPDFDPAVPAFYYARVLENPTCRWSRRVCNDLHVDCATLAADSPVRACCDGSVADTVQERAWTSPIWYLPPR